MTATTTPTTPTTPTGNAAVWSAVPLGVSAAAVRVEVSVTAGLPGFEVVGLPGDSVREVRDRVRAALMCSGFRWPLQRVTVNIAPATPRLPSCLDLPIAVGILVASGQLEPAAADCSYWGELGLDGSVRTTAGAVGAVSAIAAVTSGVLFVPASADVLPQFAGTPATTDTVRTLGVSRLCEVAYRTAPAAVPAVLALAAEVAAAGGHHVLCSGDADAASSLAATVRDLMPDLDPTSAGEVAAVFSAACLPVPEYSRPPLRTVDGRESMVALLGGGGSAMRPGEVTLSHRGVLSIPALPGLATSALDGLRAPMSTGEVRPTRGRQSCTMPAACTVVAGAQRCRCGAVPCLCSDAALSRWRARLAASTLASFDVRVSSETELPGVSSRSFAESAARVLRARAAAAYRPALNAYLSDEQVEAARPLTVPAINYLLAEVAAGRLSHRGACRVRRLALTLADLDGNAGPIGADTLALAAALHTLTDF